MTCFQVMCPLCVPPLWASAQTDFSPCLSQGAHLDQASPCELSNSDSYTAQEHMHYSPYAAFLGHTRFLLQLTHQLDYDSLVVCVCPP